jgi:DNA primase
MDMIEVLSSLGYRPVSKSNTEYMYVAKYRDDTKPSLCVNSVKNYWYDFGIGKGGKLVDLLMLILKTNKVSEVINHCNKHLHLFSFNQQENGHQKEKKRFTRS